MANFSSHAVAPALYPKLGYTVEHRLHAADAGGRDAQRAGVPRRPARRTLKDVIALCRAKPGQVSFGSAGQGSAQHLALEMFKLRAKVDALHVPYKGSGPMLADLLGGQIDFSFETMSSAVQLVKQGKLWRSRRPARSARSSSPTCRRSRNSASPASRPPPGTAWSARPRCRRRWRAHERGHQQGARHARRAEKLEGYSAEGGGGSMQRFAEFMAEEQVRWGKVIKDAKVTA
jgi:hypothetical protein